MPGSRNKVAKRAKPTEIISHWPKLIENLKFSPQEFYSRVETALAVRQVPDLEVSHVDWKEGGALSPRREYLRLKRERLVFDVCGAPFGTGFFVSIWCGERPYRLAPIIFGAVAIAALGIWGWESLPPYAAFQLMRVYWELGLLGTTAVAAAMLLMSLLAVAVLLGPRLDNLLIRTPAVGFIYERYFRKITYYRVDRMCMYQQAVHAAVMQVIDEITKSQDIVPLSELDRRPIMKELVHRAGSNGRN